MFYKKTWIYSSLSLLSLLVMFSVVTSSESVGAQETEQLRASGISQTTTFTYQGRLTEGGIPATGTYDFVFALYDAANGSDQLGSAIPIEDVAVNDGYFTVQLDFGGNDFRGDTRYLEVRVRAGGETGSYTLLDPRRIVTSVPYAVYANRASALSAADDNPENGVYVSENGNVGVGNRTPTERLDVAGNITASGTICDGSGCIGDKTSVWNRNGSEIYYSGDVGIGSSNTTARLYVVKDEKGWATQIINTNPAGDGLKIAAGSTKSEGVLSALNYDESQALFRVMGDGKVGIGTSSPVSVLHIRGVPGDPQLAIEHPADPEGPAGIRKRDDGTLDIFANMTAGEHKDIVFWSGGNGSDEAETCM
ncbi:hypothetical protein KFU94_06165 [Chloroflexi bacterium TSY]|nr:hypothetical protein [Chloroflexi bacterium TSY]